MATHTSILAWKILWTEEPGGLQAMGLERVGVTEHACMFTLRCGYRDVDTDMDSNIKHYFNDPDKGKTIWGELKLIQMQFCKNKSQAFDIQWRCSFGVLNNLLL